MSETSIKIPDTVQRAVGFELTATKLENFGDEWAVFAQQYRGFSEQIKEQSLSGGMPEELWEKARQTLLDERENSSSNWLQIDFFPSVASENNSTNGTTSNSTSNITVNAEKTHHKAIVTPTFQNSTDTLKDKEEADMSYPDEVINAEETEDEELVDDDPLQQDLIQRAVPILFAALDRYGSVSNMGLDIELKGERNCVTWSILDRTLTVQGEENLSIEFNANRQVQSFHSQLSPEYVEHLENQVATQLEVPKNTKFIDKNISR